MLFRRCLLLLAAFSRLLRTQERHRSISPGPNLEVKVTRGGVTLPAGQVPNLNAGDQLWIKADLPPTQSAHYLMVAAFLSGATNPPPESWFYPCKLWTGKCGTDGLTVTVPQGAQQVLLFFAPETGGDLRTVVGAVRGRPGAFVRTSQDLNQAALDRSRLERFLAAVNILNQGDPAKLKDAAPLLARSLAIKVDDKCLDRIPELRAPCLMQGQESLILNDGHSTSIVEALTSGPGSDLAMEASYTPQLSYGYYSPYIASVLDIARIMDSFRTAQYQYIPALASPRGDKIALTLNAPPSFHNPKSVLVVALPAVEQPQLPPLHAVDPKEIYCIRRSTLVLPVDGAPLAFSTSYAHDLTLSLTGRDGKTIDLPARADPVEGGYVVDTAGLKVAVLGDSVHAVLKGYWGFDPYEGPTFRLINVHAKAWDLGCRRRSGAHRRTPGHGSSTGRQRQLRRCHYAQGSRRQGTEGRLEDHAPRRGRDQAAAAGQRTGFDDAAGHAIRRRPTRADHDSYLCRRGSFRWLQHAFRRHHRRTQRQPPRRSRQLDPEGQHLRSRRAVDSARRR
jgi:hypothetical protein